ncbi:MAG TPA: hypothetical protein VH583_23760 [Vicinamibacterales bacterium]|jgi:hypothetical protein
MTVASESRGDALAHSGSARIAAIATAALAVLVFYAGIHWGSTVAGGADSYGYVSQASLWRQGALFIHQDIVRPSPWPLASETWAPLGFLPAPGSRDAIVPLYPPGLPMLMAVFQAVGGFCAAFVITPLCGALTVYLTFLIGMRAFAKPLVSFAAAALVAASPIFLYQLMNPMSDVPVTAAWTLAILLAMDRRQLAAGVAAAVAVLIRPNLAPAFAVPCAWLWLVNGRPWRFVAGIVPAIVFVLVLNTKLYGSPLLSGYGSTGDLYALSFAATNIRQFSAWMFETQTPFVLLAVVYLILPREFVSSRVPHDRWLIGGGMAAVELLYLFYRPFDAWWYLRFLLPMWPLMMIACAAAVDALTRRAHRFASPAALGITVVILGVVGVATAAERLVFDIGRGERRYVDVARFVATHTDDRAVMIALQHTGTLRMYAGRMTLRFDQLDPAWLDRAVRFLEQGGRHPYIVLEGDEERLFKQRFADSAIGRLDWNPTAVFERPRITIYDAVERNASEPLAIAAAASRRAGWRCDPPYAWPPPLRIK